MHITPKPSRRAAGDRFLNHPDAAAPEPGSLADIIQILRGMTFDDALAGITYVAVMVVMLMVLALFG